MSENALPSNNQRNSFLSFFRQQWVQSLVTAAIIAVFGFVAGRFGAIRNNSEELKLLRSELDVLEGNITASFKDMLIETKDEIVDSLTTTEDQIQSKVQDNTSNVTDVRARLGLQQWN